MEARKDSFKRTALDIVREINTHTQLLRKASRELKLSALRAHCIDSNASTPTLSECNYHSLLSSSANEEEFCNNLLTLIKDLSNSKITMQEIKDSKVVDHLLGCSVETQSRVIKEISFAVMNSRTHNAECAKLMAQLLDAFECAPVKYVSGQLLE